MLKQEMEKLELMGEKCQFVRLTRIEGKGFNLEGGEGSNLCIFCYIIK